MDSDPIGWHILLQIFLIILNAVFACAEIAVISINDNKLERLSAEGDKRATMLLSLTNQPSKFLATIQVGITFAGFLGSAFAADNFSKRIVDWLLSIGVKISPITLGTISVIFITIILSYFTLVLGELVPKRIAMQNAERLGLAMSGFVYFLSKIFAPVVWFLTISTNSILRLLHIDPNADNDEVTEEEIRMMIDVGSENGAIDDDEKYLIHNVFEFDNKTADAVMTHRTEVSMLWLEESDDDWYKTIRESRHTYYPICDETADDVVGILSTKDYFRLQERNRDTVMKNAVRPPQFVPESVRTDILFENMKKTRNHFAVVLDEYGGVSGIITINDLLEQIVGDLDDDFTIVEHAPLIEKIDSDTWKIMGITPLNKVAETLKVKLPTDEYDTFAGMVLSLLGTIPGDGQTPEIEEFGLVIKITQVKEHRLICAVVSLTKEG